MAIIARVVPRWLSSRRVACLADQRFLTGAVLSTSVSGCAQFSLDFAVTFAVRKTGMGLAARQHSDGVLIVFFPVRGQPGTRSLSVGTGKRSRERNWRKTRFATCFIQWGAWFTKRADHWQFFCRPTRQTGVRAATIGSTSARCAGLAETGFPPADQLSPARFFSTRSPVFRPSLHRISTEYTLLLNARGLK